MSKRLERQAETTRLFFVRMLISLLELNIRRDDVMKVIKSLWTNTSSRKGRHARSMPSDRLPATVCKK